MLGKIVLAVVVGVAVTLGCILVGALLAIVNVSLAVTLGDFLKTYAAAFGILAALWRYFGGRL